MKNRNDMKFFKKCGYFFKRNFLKLIIVFILALWLHPFLPLNPTFETYSLLPITALFKTNPLNAMWIALSYFGGAFATLGIGYVQAIKFLPFSIPLMAFLTLFELFILCEPIIIAAILYIFFFVFMPYLYRHLFSIKQKKRLSE